MTTQYLGVRSRQLADKPRPILLVDDCDKDVELILMALQEDARIINQIDVAYNGEEAFDYLYQRGKFKNRAKINPVAILLDLKMPKVDGFELLKTLKKDKDLQFIPIVILTSSTENRDIVESYANGANAFVEKSVDPQKFKNAIKHLGLFWGIINIVPNSK